MMALSIVARSNCARNAQVRASSRGGVAERPDLELCASIIDTPAGKQDRTRDPYVPRKRDLFLFQGAYSGLLT